MEVGNYRVAQSEEIKLSTVDPRDRSGFSGARKDARSLQVDLTKRLEALQELLYAEGKHKVLIVLQAMDAGGKDGTIRHVFEGTNPQGVKVTSFKKPTHHELAHDYLWRVHRRVPGKGEIGIFNRSHYEDVLVVRVNNLVSPEVWEKRYEQIVQFENMLVDEGTTILKFFLNISMSEQKERFEARLAEPTKHWKFSVGDLAVRDQWDSYMEAYEAVLNRTSTAKAPWYMIPADRKWYRNLVISKILVNQLESLDMKFPEPEEGLEQVVVV
jgi:PPK2 family polyphosphate:nucleotide phosphotransferase